MAVKADKKEKVSQENRAHKESKDSQSSQWQMLLMLNGGLCLVALLGAYLSFSSKSKAYKYFVYVDGYDQGALLSVLGIVSVVVFMVCVMGCVLCHLATDPKKRLKLKHMLYAYVGWAGGFVVLLILSSLLVLLCINTLSSALKTGFTNKMASYSKDPKVKASLDAVQKDLMCCGNHNFTEWFVISWSDTIAKTEMGVPESCCDKAAADAMKTPCITSAAFQESIRLTPYKIGCVEKLVSHYKMALLKDVGVFVVSALLGAASVFITFTTVKSPATAIAAPDAANEKKKLLEDDKTNNNKSTNASSTKKSKRKSRERSKEGWDRHTPSKHGYQQINKKNHFSTYEMSYT